MQHNHLILYYKGDISALTLFCQQADGSVCFPPLPKLSVAVDEDQRTPQPVDLFPTQSIKAVNSQLRLDNDLLMAETGFYEQVETPQGIAMVYLARFQLLDPPHRLMEARQCRM